MSLTHCIRQYMNLIKHAIHRVSPQNKMSGDLKKELEKKRAKLDRLKRERELKAKELQDDVSLLNR